LVTVVTRDAQRVLLDASVIVNFADTGMLIVLAQYLGSRAAITLDVDRELRRLAGSSRPALATLDRMRWPAGDPLALPPDLLAEAETLRKLNALAGTHVAANRGEIATALLATRLAGAIVVMDDALGKRLCQRRGVPRVSSAQLAAEMVAAGAFDTEAGYTVFDEATPAGVGRSEFKDALERARAALS
jgi:hypothetical protein